ncbi:hypothetical protein N7G274_002331 [Stereocaulon virgatum]|uniref:Uncharacterized protein n=1 Tax=Stereocaulon virgatum TaxID=373712 RepID=A0ABR4APA2_9LECA
MSLDDCSKRARIEHELWTILAQNTAPESAQPAQPSYKEFTQGLQGEFRKSEAGDNEVNLEGPLHPLFGDNSFEIAIKDLLKATLKAREATETAEALALYPSHLINHLDDVDVLQFISPSDHRLLGGIAFSVQQDVIQKDLDKIEERYRELRNIDAAPGRRRLDRAKVVERSVGRCEKLH